MKRWWKNEDLISYHASRQHSDRYVEPLYVFFLFFLTTTFNIALKDSTQVWENNSQITEHKQQTIVDLHLLTWEAYRARWPTRSGHDRSIEGPRSRIPIAQSALPSTVWLHWTQEHGTTATNVKSEDLHQLTLVVNTNTNGCVTTFMSAEKQKKQIHKE